ncbi:uncharacterized protein LOC105700434 [Orussus abietinus]|uniref:uncharacterized protein LOC105700434 n=1 Tax=Orussus abietinus TaxID=222816 RepID=UPI000C715EB6|nr:uncharacterized protein LOC105700434 [Orussus abietinus]
MLFLWAREPSPGPTGAGPWLAWFATAVLLWRCRRRIAKAILAVSPFRLLVRRCVASVEPVPQGALQRAKLETMQQTKYSSTGLRARVKRLCTGDGPHVHSGLTAQPSQQVLHYRVTRSGRVYGKYPNKVVPKKQ